MICYYSFSRLLLYEISGGVLCLTRIYMSDMGMCPRLRLGYLMKEFRPVGPKGSGKFSWSCGLSLDLIGILSLVVLAGPSAHKKKKQPRREIVYHILLYYKLNINHPHG